MSHTHNQWDKSLEGRALFYRRILLSIVLGLMSVYLLVPSAAAPRMLSCRLSAAIDLMPRIVTPGKPDTSPIFNVAGWCTFPTPGFSVELKPHAPASPDPKILLLDAVVHAPTNPVASGPTDVPVTYSPPLSKTSILWEKVIILPDNLVLTVKRPR